MPSPSIQPPGGDPFVWQPEAAGAAWITAHVARFRSASPTLEEFAEDLRTLASGRLIDWVDHLQISKHSGVEESGFRNFGNEWYMHPGALLPPVHLGQRDQLFLKVDSVSDFVAANRRRFRFHVAGMPLDFVRTATINDQSPVTFGVIERHGCHPTKTPPVSDQETRLALLDVRESFLNRERRSESDEAAFAETRRLIDSAISRLGRDLTCDAFFQAERAYWQSGNRAGRIQYMRQQALGLGWGNHDHHTYRSSRENFHRLIGLLETLGFECRERFYAGADAGWGAQVLQHPVCGIVIFADVDLDPAEITGDIAHEPLPPRDKLGTIGLWCALHGEAVLQAGMHHLECQFDFDHARSQLADCGIGCMKPFTDFPWLRQCFTDGEIWNVDPERINRAAGNGWITPEQAERFRRDGAVGSHLEVLERNDGYRGFNQTGINEIILKTDPRSLNAPTENH